MVAMGGINHCGHHILVIECIILSSDLTGSWVNRRDVTSRRCHSIPSIFQFEE